MIVNTYWPSHLNPTWSYKVGIMYPFKRGTQAQGSHMTWANLQSWEVADESVWCLTPTPSFFSYPALWDNGWWHPEYLPTSSGLDANQSERPLAINNHCAFPGWWLSPEVMFRWSPKVCERLGIILRLQIWSSTKLVTSVWFSIYLILYMILSAINEQMPSCIVIFHLYF